ncbi:MAG: hypothetical protein WBV82_09485 [Myxococcaceae bacterium]
MRIWKAALLMTFAVGCAPRYRLNAHQAESPVLPEACELEVLQAAPDRGYSIVGEVEPEDPAKLATDLAAFVDAIRTAACKHGGNAVIAVTDETGRYSRGTVISVR